MPLPRFTSYDDQLADYLSDRLNIPLDFEGLTAKSVADIAVIAAAASEDFAGTAHLLALLAAVPTPTSEADDFWHQLWQASGSAHFIPANIGPRIRQALSGEPAPLADQILSALADMSDGDRTAAIEVIGKALDDNPDLSGHVPSYLGKLWLTDVEQTAWRVLLASRTRPESANAAYLGFREAWSNH